MGFMAFVRTGRERKTFRFCFPASTLNTKRKPKATYKLAIFTQNCFPSSNKINEAFSMGARGGSESSALAQPNEMVACRWTSWMCALKLALVSFSSKQFSPAGQQKKFATFSALGRQIGRLSDDALQDRGRRALKLKLPHEVESSDPSVRDIDGHLITAVCFASGLKLESKLMEVPIDHVWEVMEFFVWRLKDGKFIWIFENRWNDFETFVVTNVSFN